MKSLRESVQGGDTLADGPDGHSSYGQPSE